jgi:hypothetical protein
MAPSKKVVASLVTLLVLDNKEKQEKVKKKKKWCKNWLLHRHLYSHMNLLNELRVYKPADFKHYLLFSRIPPPPGGTAILPEYIHYYG